MIEATHEYRALEPVLGEGCFFSAWAGGEGQTQIHANRRCNPREPPIIGASSREPNSRPHSPAVHGRYLLARPVGVALIAQNRGIEVRLIGELASTVGRCH